MATIVDNLFDIHLVCNDTDKNTYGCGQCSKLATNAKGLRCDEKYHDHTPTLYCDKCAILIQTTNKCPVNQHENPTFSDEKIFQVQIQKNIKFMCPYSLHQNNHDDKKQHSNDLCQWNGTYIQLQNHVKICKYKPKKIFEKDKQITQLRNQINILKEKMCSIETFQNVANKETAGKDKKIAELHKEIKILKRAMNCCDCCDYKSSCKVLIIIGFICCILLAIIIANYNNLMILYRETSNIYVSKVRDYGNETTVRIELLVKQFDELNMSMKLYNISVSELNTMVKNLEINCTENINTNIERIDSRIDNIYSMAMQNLNKDIQTNMSEISLWNWNNKMKEVLYYTGKLFGHGINMFYLFHSCSAHIRLNSVYRWKLLMVSVVSYLVVNIYYFYYVNWIVMFILIGFGFVGIEIVHNNVFESIYVNENCFLLIVELNVLYWRIWCNDDKILVTLVCGLWIYLVSVLKGKISQHHFAIVFSVVSLCINCFCILEWI
eukprot:212387_1